MNNALMIVKNLPMLLSSRNLVVFFALTVILGIGSVSLAYYLFDVREQAMAVEREIQGMASYMSTFKQKEAELNSITERPVEAKEVDAVQTDILLLMQSHHAQIMDLKVVKDGGTRESQSVVYKEDEKKTVGEQEAAKAVQNAPNAGDAAKAAAKQNAEVSAHRAYDVKLRGTYENLISFVQRFGVKGKLLTIRKFSISPMDDGTYVADVRYKIYVK